MNVKKNRKYEKPVSIDMGRVAPVLGDRCSNGNAATDCGLGFNNSSVPICQPTGAAATDQCKTGFSANPFCNAGDHAIGGCYPTGSSVGGKSGGTGSSRFGS